MKVLARTVQIGGQRSNHVIHTVFIVQKLRRPGVYRTWSQKESVSE